MYKSLVRPILFSLDPEKVHHFSFSMIKFLNKIPGVSYLIRRQYLLEDKRLEREVFGIKFKNPVGLAAGFDKDAKLYNELGNFGFGFVEIGTVTLKPQAGSPKKRLFRLKEDKALINRMGFNNDGVLKCAERLKKGKSLIIGGNIGKNKTTPNDSAHEDYLACVNELHDYVDYFVVNVSSPNTPNLRELQEKEPLKKLLSLVKSRLGVLSKEKKLKPKPLLLKIAPDLNEGQLLDIINIVKETDIAGIIATNTTIDRSNLKSANQNELGGLSGEPLKNRATEVIRFLAEKSDKAFPIIGVGGISSAQNALEKLDAGADLVQIYTGFVYEGPGLIRNINKKLLTRLEN
ncbi:MAG: quinone-dependent dihydroorotate dehydrogenase [Flavobacteriaceae bacterium]|nr:quinone-dependent dihydroorotate dehydrogenase [Flavobacteriaceae bacterium]